MSSTPQALYREMHRICVKDGNVYSFGRWLLDQKGRNDPTGDLARDFDHEVSNERADSNSSIADMFWQLSEHQAAEVVREVFYDAIVEYRTNPYWCNYREMRMLWKEWEGDSSQ